MALHPCAECQEKVSDKALACPHCGMPQPAGEALVTARRRGLLLGGALVVLVALGGAGLAGAFRQTESGGMEYERVEKLRAEQDSEGTHDQNVRQRYYRLYKSHPQSAMYAYLWARLLDEAPEQQKVAEEGLHDDPRFSWNYNVLARALARQHKIPEAYEQAKKGLALDPGNMQLADKEASLKAILDHKLDAEPPPDPDAKGYVGLFRSAIQSPDRMDFQAIVETRLAGVRSSEKGEPGDKGEKPRDESKAVTPEAIRGFVLCANPFADSCARVYVPRDARFKEIWAPSGTSSEGLKEHQFLSVTGTVVKNARGEGIFLADAVTVGAR